MGNSISAIYDDYKDYVYICSITNNTPVDIRDINKCFYEHEMEIFKSYGVRNQYDLYEKINENLNK